MKVIGITEVQSSQYRKDKGYVVIVTEDELKKVADKASYRDDKFTPLHVGQDYDLAAGYNFREALTQSIKSMTEAYEHFAKVAPLAAQFAGLVTDKQAAKPDA